jgi:PPOX class probable F420-dependent enzyme
VRDKTDVCTSPSEGLRVLAVVPYCRLTTFRRDGTPVGVPVWQAVSDGKVWVFTETSSWKVKRLRRDPRVEVTTCDMRGALDGGPNWTGKGRVVTDAETIARAYRALDAKYGWKKWIVDTMSKFAGRYDKRAMLEITLDD